MLTPSLFGTSFRAPLLSYAKNSSTDAYLLLSEQLGLFNKLHLAPGDLRVTATATGRVEGLNTVEVGAEVSGRVLFIRADYNDRVKKGQVLAEIDPDTLSPKEALDALYRLKALQKESP